MADLGDASFADVFVAMQVRRHNEAIEAAALASILEQLAGPHGRVMGDGDLAMELRPRETGHMAARRGVVEPPEVRVIRA